MTTPTERVSQCFHLAYTHLNGELFDGGLPECLITLQRHRHSFGYFCGNRFVNPYGETTDEIALNPAYFMARTDVGVLSTLAHEMCHLWQHHFGRSGRRGYHNRQWANKMIEVGLYPSHTGESGGRETGDQMTHYIVTGGRFEAVCGEMLASGFCIPWADNEDLRAFLQPPSSKPVKGVADRSNRWKYTCPKCRLNAWSRPHASLACGACRLTMLKN